MKPTAEQILNLRKFLQCGDLDGYDGDVDILTLTDKEDALLLNLQSPIANDQTIQPGQLLVHMKSISLAYALERTPELLFRLKPETVFFRCGKRIMQIDATYFDAPQWFINMQNNLKSEMSA